MRKTPVDTRDTKKRRHGPFLKAWKLATRFAIDPNGTRWIEICTKPNWETYIRIKND